MHCVQQQIFASMCLKNKLESHHFKAPKARDLITERGKSGRDVIRLVQTPDAGPTRGLGWGCITLPFFVNLLKSILLDPIEGRLWLPKGKQRIGNYAGHVRNCHDDVPGEVSKTS